MHYQNNIYSNISLFVVDLRCQVKLQFSKTLGQLVLEEERPVSGHAEHNLRGDGGGLAEQIEVTGREGQIYGVLNLEPDSSLFFAGVLGPE